MLFFQHQFRRIEKLYHLHLLFLKYFLKNFEKYEKKVYVLPKHLDEKVAMLHLNKVGAKLTKLSKDQADYISVDVKGPFKSDSYRY